MSAPSVPPCSPSPACPSSAGTVPPTPSNTVDPQVCIPISYKVPFCLQVLASPSVTVTDQLYFWLLCLLTLIAQVSGLCVFVSLPFLILLTDKISIPTLHASLPISVTDWVCSHPDLPHHVLVRFVFVLVYGSFDQIPSKERILSFHIPLQVWSDMIY